MGDSTEVVADAEAREAVASHPVWYHTIEVAPGLVTPGWFDLRPVVERMPWPDVRGKRCLDVGTFDGFLAFELERRGAAEVVATDVDDPGLWDWPPHLRRKGPAAAEAMGPKQGSGFAIAKRVLGSSVERVPVNVYDLSPDTVGEFDVVVCGSLLLHLRDPLRGLEAIRGVCRDLLLSSDQVDFGLSARHRHRPLARLDGRSDLMQWWVPNVAGHVQMLTASGFSVEQTSGLYAIPFGRNFPREKLPRKRLLERPLRRVLAGGEGVPHHAALCRPVA